MVLAGGCIAAFALVPSGTTSLITPVSFHRKWDLTGTELDFSNADCVQWLIKHVNDRTYSCDLAGLNAGSRITSGFCDNSNQLVVLLESGRSSVSRQLKIIYN